MLDDTEVSIKVIDANKLIWDCEKKLGAYEEFHKCIVSYILKNLC